MRRLITLALLAAGELLAQPTFTQISQTIYTPASFQLFVGTLQISNPVAVTTNGSLIGQWAQTVQITNGLVTVQLVPTDTATPPGTNYVFRFTPQLNNGSPWYLYCNVPTTSSTVTISQICATSPGSTINVNQLSQGLAVTGNYLAFNGTYWAPATFPITVGTPASSSAACTPPAIQFDSSFAYYCVATNTWRRVATSAF